MRREPARQDHENQARHVTPRARSPTSRSQIVADDKDITAFQTAIANPSISTTDKLILETLLRGDQQDKIAATQLLLQADAGRGAPHRQRRSRAKITARSRRNTVVIAAVIGLILGALAALLWDSVAPRLVPRNDD